jgi:hypothetical protein
VLFRDFLLEPYDLKFDIKYVNSVFFNTMKITGIGKKMSVSYFKIILLHLPGGTKVNYRELSGKLISG